MSSPHSPGIANHNTSQKPCQPAAGLATALRVSDWQVWTGRWVSGRARLRMQAPGNLGSCPRYAWPCALLACMARLLSEPPHHGSRHACVWPARVNIVASPLAQGGAEARSPDSFLRNASLPSGIGPLVPVSEAGAPAAGELRTMSLSLPLHQGSGGGGSSSSPSGDSRLHASVSRASAPAASPSAASEAQQQQQQLASAGSLSPQRVS